MSSLALVSGCVPAVPAQRAQHDSVVRGVNEGKRARAQLHELIMVERALVQALLHSVSVIEHQCGHTAQAAR